MISRDSIWKKKENYKGPNYIKIGKIDKDKDNFTEGYLIETSRDNLSYQQETFIVEEKLITDNYDYTGKCKIPKNDRTLCAEDILEQTEQFENKRLLRIEND